MVPSTAAGTGAGATGWAAGCLRAAGFVVAVLATAFVCVVLVAAGLAVDFVGVGFVLAAGAGACLVTARVAAGLDVDGFEVVLLTAFCAPFVGGLLGALEADLVELFAGVTARFAVPPAFALGPPDLAAVDRAGAFLAGAGV